MLKIHSFLRQIKDTLKDFVKKMLRKYSKYMAATAYVLSAAILVFYFGNFADMITSSFRYTANAASYENVKSEPEEITCPEVSTGDTTEYALINPYTNILQNTEVFTNYPKLAFSVMQAIKSQLENTERKTDENLELFSLEQVEMEQDSSEVYQNTTSEQKADIMDADKLPQAEKTFGIKTPVDLPSNLSLVFNSGMQIQITDEELEVLHRIVEAEATGEDVYGKILVANVVLNRVMTEEFPDTISEVVFQKVGNAVQFSPTKDGRYWSVKVTDSTKEAVARALNGEDYSKGALYFFARRLTTKTKANWFDTSLNKVLQHGCHEFYANKIGG